MDYLSLSVSSIKSSTMNGGKVDKFAETFAEIRKAISKEFAQMTGDSAHMETSLKWLTSVLEYNVPHGKQIRGRMVEKAYKTLVAREVSEEKLEKARVLGWIVEILQAACLIADDIMDGGIKRRGKACWYHVDNMGNTAFNDTLMLEHFALQLLRIHFGHDPDLHNELLEIILDVSFKTALGQNLDLINGKSGNFAGFSTSLYYDIVTFKTGYYTTYGPLAAAMILAGLSPKKPENQQLWKTATEIALKIGTLFQIQDDYLDCYGEVSLIGKVGMDIQEGKCTWLFVTASEKCTSDQLQILLENYGVNESAKVAKVKEIYNQLDLGKHFLDCQRALYKDILNLIRQLDFVEFQMAAFTLLKKIYKRAY